MNAWSWAAWSGTENAILSTPFCTSAAPAPGSPFSRSRMNAASLSTASHVSSGGLRMDNCSLVHSWRASAALSDATIGPGSTTTFLCTLVVIGENRLVQIPLAGRSVPPTAAHRADQVAGEVGAGELAARRRALYEGGFERLADAGGLRDPAAARLCGGAAAPRGRQLGRQHVRDAM